MKTCKKAFSLVELMIVIAILGIITAIAIPGFIRAREQAKKRKNGESEIVTVYTNGVEKEIEIGKINKIGANLYFLKSDYSSTDSYYSNEDDIVRINASLTAFLKSDDFRIRDFDVVNGGVYIVTE